MGMFKQVAAVGIAYVGLLGGMWLIASADDFLGGKLIDYNWLHGVRIEERHDAHPLERILQRTNVLKLSSEGNSYTMYMNGGGVVDRISTGTANRSCSNNHPGPEVQAIWQYFSEPLNIYTSPTMTWHLMYLLDYEYGCFSY